MMPPRLALLFALMLASPLAVAADGAPAPEPPLSFFGELLSIMVPLVLIIAVLLAVLHFARRRYGLTGQDAPLSVVQVLPLGPRERIVLVKTRSGRVFAVGVAAQSLSLITDLDPADLLAAQAPGDAQTSRTDVTSP